MAARTTFADALAAARPYLRGEEDQCGDPALPVPALTAVLRAAHLLEVYRILRLWAAPDAFARCGQYHSAYSNSYVNLAIFEPDVGRRGRRRERGRAPRPPLLRRPAPAARPRRPALPLRRRPVLDARRGVFDEDEPWRRKIQRLLPAEGIAVKHIRTGEDVALSRRVAATFLMMTMADFSDQLFDWQDRLFDNTNGRLEFRGNIWTSLWPGTGKPGLWTTSISRMGVLYSLIVREEEIYIAHRAHTTGQEGNDSAATCDEDITFVIPPVFDGCTKVLDADDQKAARDLYWGAVCSGEEATDLSKVEEMLRQSIAKNPFVGEPRLVLAQMCLNAEMYEEAQEQAEEGLKLLLE